ncbi:hypothetical protein SprV_0602221900 [Sparganum proliferum]
MNSDSVLENEVMDIHLPGNVQIRRHKEKIAPGGRVLRDGGFEGKNGRVNATATAGRWESGRVERTKQWRLDKLANDGADRRGEMIVAVAC